MTIRTRWVVVGAVLAAGLATSAALVRSALSIHSGAVSADVSADVLRMMSGPAEGYDRVTGPQDLVFPSDDGPHPDFQTEWWYFTGNVAAEGPQAARDAPGTPGAVIEESPARGAGASSGASSRAVDRRFGYQLTFFRRAVAPPNGGDPPSGWTTAQLYMGHFAVTDVAAGRHASFERLARGAVGLAGAQAEPFRVWLLDWFAEAPDGEPIRLVARASSPHGPAAVDLTLMPTKPRVLHGDAGYSPKGPVPGNASYYVSRTRLASTGWVTTAGGAFRVSGWSWMDHEWSTSALAEDRVGWDWFSLQLDDGTEVMVYQIRDGQGAPAAESAGSLVGPGGAVASLSREDFRLEVLETWASPDSGATYPIRWRLSVPAADMNLEIEPLILDQEMDTTFRYWEGAVRITGTRDEEAVGGYGYAELTGYAGGGAGPGLFDDERN